MYVCVWLVGLPAGERDLIWLSLHSPMDLKVLQPFYGPPIESCIPCIALAIQALGLLYQLLWQHLHASASLQIVLEWQENWFLPCKELGVNNLVRRVY